MAAGGPPPGPTPAGRGADGGLAGAGRAAAGARAAPHSSPSSWTGTLRSGVASSACWPIGLAVLAVVTLVAALDEAALRVSLGHSHSDLLERRDGDAIVSDDGEGWE